MRYNDFLSSLTEQAAGNVYKKNSVIGKKRTNEGFVSQKNVDPRDIRSGFHKATSLNQNLVPRAGGMGSSGASGTPASSAQATTGAGFGTALKGALARRNVASQSTGNDFLDLLGQMHTSANWFEEHFGQEEGTRELAGLVRSWAHRLVQLLVAHGVDMSRR